MATLTGQRIKDSYKDLLQVSNSNSGIDSTLRVISDGEATDSVLQLSTTAVNISSAGALQYAGVAITSTAAELNILDGATVTVAELNVLDGYTGSVTELNYLDTLHATGVTATEFDYLDGVTSSIQVQLDATFDTVGTGLDTSGTTISLDLNELGTETSIADADFLVMVDATDDGSQKITFENLEDAIFSSVSGDITITEAGVAAIQANSVALSTDTTGNYVGTVTAGTGLTSTGATSGEGIAHSLSVDVAQTQITSLGTLTALTVDNVSINGTTIGHTSDTDLITLADGNVTIAGELDLTTLDVSGDADIDGTLEADAITVNGTALNTVIAGVTVANATLAATTTVSDSTANTTFPVVFHDESNALLDDTGALRYNPSTGELLVPKLTVAGTTTTVDTVTMEAANAIKFEGATADANETILSIVDPTNDDNTQYLLNASGYIPLLNAVSTTVITATPTELNYVDGVTSNIQTQLDATLDTAGTGIDISSTTVSVDVSDFMANGADNRILTATGTDAMNAESSLTFDGTDLKLLGDDLEMRWGAGQDFKIYVTSDDAYLVNVREDKDIRFMVNDGNGTSGANITAIQIDASAVGQVKLPNDSQILSLGASQDLQFYHNGTNSFGADNYTGHLIFQNRADDSDIIFKTDDGSGGVTAYLTLDGSQGFTVASKNIMFTDDVQALFGNASDMVIKHDGSNNRIQGANGDMYISNYADDKDVILQTDDGSGGVTPYITLDGSAGYTVVSKQIRSNDNVALTAGTDGDLNLVHDGTNSYVENWSGDLYIRNNNNDKDIILQSDDGSGGVTAYITLDGSQTRTNVSKDLRLDDSVNLQLGGGGDMSMSHDGSNATFSNATGNLTIQTSTDDGTIIFNCDDGSGGLANYYIIDGANSINKFYKHIRLPVDSQEISVGAGNDLLMKHDGTNSHIQNGTGDLVITQNTDDADIRFKCDDGSGGTTDYITLDGSAGYTTVQKRIRFDDDVTLALGTSPDTLISSNGSNTFFDQNIGNLFFRANTNDGSIHFQADDGSGGLAGYMDIDGQNSVIDIFQDIQLTATKKLYFDTGGANTYIVESADDILDFYAGGDLMLRLDETNNIVSIPQDAANATFIMGDTATWEQYVSGNDVILRNKVSTGHIRMLTDNSVENIRMIDTEVTINEGSADMDFRVESNGEANMLFVDGGNNNVIIGNNAPVTCTGQTAAFQVLGTGNGDTHLNIGRFSNNASAPILTFTKSRSGTIGTSTIIQDDDNCGGIVWCVADGTDFESSIANIGAAVDGTPGANDVPGRLVFKTTADGSAGSLEHFRIASNGDLTATDTSIASNSDLRLKKNIENFEGGLDIISKLQPRNFEWRNPEIHKEGTRRGFIAQEVNEVDEYWINTKKIQEEEKDYEYVKDTEGQSFVSKLNDKDAMYVSAIQELKREIDELKLKLGEKNG